MKKIILLMGQSNTGKDTICNKLLESDLGLKRYVYATTRPMRTGEKDGVTYHFRTVEQFQKELTDGNVVEHRVFHTAHGDWFYYTPVLGKAENGNFIITGTIDMYKPLADTYGSDNVIPVMLVVDDRERLMRSILREDTSRKDYREAARRFVDEFTEWAPERVDAVPGLKRVENYDVNVCFTEVKQCIEQVLYAE